jgi:hypothetical protein
MKGNEGYWGGGIFIITQNFPKSPSILFHPLQSSISQTSPQGEFDPFAPTPRPQTLGAGGGIAAMSLPWLRRRGWPWGKFSLAPCPPLPLYAATSFAGRKPHHQLRRKGNRAGRRERKEKDTVASARMGKRIEAAETASRRRRLDGLRRVVAVWVRQAAPSRTGSVMTSAPRASPPS